MVSLLVLVLLLTFLLGQAAASSAAMDSFMSPAPLEQFYPDPEGLLDAICNLCTISINFCEHALPHHTHHASAFLESTITEATLLNHPEWQWSREPSVLDDIPGLETVPPAAYHNHYQPLRNNAVRQLDDNGTVIRNTTIHAHIDDTYTLGDRLARGLRSRRQPSRRQQPRPGGFLCSCGKAFDRSCDLKRHEKTHLDHSERPHKCSFCSEGFLYPKDRKRHELTHDQSALPQAGFQCPATDCKNVDGFSRRDNLIRHVRKLHPHLLPLILPAP